MHRRKMVFLLLVLGIPMLVIQAHAKGSAYDVNGDGKFNDEDITMVAELFGVSNPDQRYDPKCDINVDKKIDTKDLALLAKASIVDGFFVVPEYWLGTILGLIGCFAAFGVFRLRKGKL